MKTERKKGGGRCKGILLTLLMLVTFVMNMTGQGLLTKVSKSNFIVAPKTLGGDSTVLPTINKWSLATGVTSFSINIKTGEWGKFNSAGFGLFRNEYKLDDKGQPYKTYGYGGMLLFGKEGNTPLYQTKEGVIDDTDVGLLVSGSVGPVSVGPAYFFKSKTLLLNFQLVFTFP